MSVEDLLRAESHAGGIGFCYQIDPWLFKDRSATHGPLVVAWDSNLVIYFQEHGREIIDGEEIQTVDDGLSEELNALGMLINWWFMRDIRFVVLPSLFDDEKRPAAADRRSRRHASLVAIAEALTFQTEGWGRPDIVDLIEEKICALDAFSNDPLGTLLAPFPAGAGDRRVMREAILSGADVLLTCDRRFIKRGSRLAGGTTKVLAPTDLMDRLLELGMYEPWVGGFLDHPHCPFAGHDVISGDLGKIPLLLSVLDDQ